MYQGGIQKSRVDKEREDKILIIRLPFSATQRQAIKEYAKEMLGQKAKFGFVSLISMALYKLFGWPLVIKINGTFVCSEFVANALARGGIVWPKDTAFVTPEDLYERFGKE